MEILEIKPSTPLLFKIPNLLSTQFTLSNLTLHPVCIFIVPIHKHITCINPVSAIIEAFQQLSVQTIIHWNQNISTFFKSKLRVYIWENYEDIMDSEQVKKIMFNRQSDGNCLMFEEVNLHFEIDQHLLKSRYENPHEVISNYYSVKRVKLPNWQKVAITEKIHDRLLEHCEKLGKVKAIYTYEEQFVIEYSNLTETISSFFQIRDDSDNLALFTIGCITTYGNPHITPNIINLDPPSKNSKKEEKKNIHKKQLQKQIEHHHHYHNPKVQKKSVKQSFMVAPVSAGKSRRRNKSEESIRIPVMEEEEIEEALLEQSTAIDIDWIKQYRKAQTYETKSLKEYQQSVIELSKKVLNAAIGQFQGETWIFLLFMDSVLACDVGNISNKWKIKFEPIDHENIGLKTPMVLTKDQLIFGNESYIYWVNLKGNCSTWKYVQRKEIYCLEFLDELNLLMVGGKNFSKLSYLGKSTSRTNVKVYSGGKTGKHDHLFTYDIPNCHGEIVVQMKYITTKPSGTKLLVLLTCTGLLTFLRIRSFNQIQMYSQMKCHEIGIQQISQLNYCQRTSELVCMEKLDEVNKCFKIIKVNCSYEKVEISTQGLKIPVTNYKQGSYLIGFDERSNNSWITVIEKEQGKVLLMWLDSKMIETIEISPHSRCCYIVPTGFIFHEKTSMRYKLLKTQ